MTSTNTSPAPVQPAASQEAADRAAEILALVGSIEGDGEARFDQMLSASLIANLLRVTSDEPELRWICATAAATLVLRRYGAIGTVAVTTGEPLMPGLSVTVEPPAEGTFREWLGQVRKATSNTLSRTRNSNALASASPGLVVGTELVGHDLDGALLFLDLADNRIALSSRRLSQEAVDRIARAILAILSQGLAAPDALVVNIRTLDESSLDLFREDFIESGPLDSSKPFRELLLEAAEKFPHYVAVRDEKESYTYAELCSHATTIALRLRSDGLGADDRIAIVADRSAWFLVTAVGALFSGSAYLPIDPHTPLQRRDELVRGASAVIAETNIQRPEIGQESWFDPDEFRLLTASRPLLTSTQIRSVLGRPAAPGDLAYVMFTSGSTGSPKGVCIEHHSFLNLLATRVVDYGLVPGLVTPQTAPLSFDLSIWQIFAPLTSGGTVYIVSEDDVRDPEKLVELAIAQQFGCFALVPTYISVLTSYLLDHPGPARSLMSTLRLIISTGEILSADLAAKWHATMTSVPLLNAYGPAEVADDATGGPVTATEGAHTSIGRVLPNVRVYVLDVDMHPLPPGVIGEIYIGGESVGRGYSNAPALTAAAFVPDPFSPRSGERMYKTGDRGRWRADGHVELLGRVDSQVKLRGRRVELGEIEQVLRTDLRVADVVVQVLRTSAVERLAAFVVLRPGVEQDVEESLINLASDRLPAFMVPRHISVLDRFPTNPNGKVDRKVLGEFRLEAHDRSRNYSPPRTGLEIILAEIWSKHLGVERVGMNDDFFDLGGDSITAIKIIQAVGRRGIAARPRHLLASRTVAKMALAIDSEKKVSGENQLPSGNSEPTDSPLTPVQEAFLQRGVPNPHHWNHAVLYSLGRTVDSQNVESAVATLAERHLALKTVLTSDSGGGRRQRVSASAPPVSEFDVRGVSADALRTTISDLTTELHTALNLENGPVSRVGLFRTGEGTPDRLVLVVHHLMVDLYSWDILTEDLSNLLLDTDTAPLPSTSYSEWSRRLVVEASANPERFNTDYWLGRDWAAGGRFDDSDIAGLEGNTRTLDYTFDEVWTSNFTDECLAKGVSVAEQLLVLLGGALEKGFELSSDYVQVQLGGHGREDILDGVDVTATVGYFSTAFPFLLPVLPNPTDAIGTRDVAELLRAVPNRGLDYEVMRYLHPDPRIRKDLSEVPRPQFLFNFWGEPDYLRDTSTDEDEPENVGTIFTEIEIEAVGEDRPIDMPRPVPIEVYVRIAARRLTVNIQYSGESVQHSQIKAVQALYLLALRSVVRPTDQTMKTGNTE